MPILRYVQDMSRLKCVRHFLTPFFWRAMNPAYTLNLNYARIVFKLFCVHKETYLRLALHTEIGI